MARIQFKHSEQLPQKGLDTSSDEQNSIAFEPEHDQRSLNHLIARSHAQNEKEREREKK